MTGYQETLTDPSYAGQIVMMTAPHIGNTGMNDTDMESKRIWVSGFVVRDPSRIVSNFRAQRSLTDDLVADDIVGISSLDTRAVTRHIRDKGAMRSGIFSGSDYSLDAKEQLAQVTSVPDMAGQNLSDRVSTEEAYVASYCARMGIETVPNWSFCLAFSFFRLAAILQGVLRRSLDGNGSNPERGLKMGRNVPVLASMACDLVGVAP